MEGTPHLWLFATKEITRGQELRYNYRVDGLWWHKQVSFILDLIAGITSKVQSSFHNVSRGLRKYVRSILNQS